VKYMKMTVTERESLLADLASMPDFVERMLGQLTSADALIRGSDGLLSPVEQCWHLADLERDAYAVRIQRLLREPNPDLPDFDGGRIARERNYAALALTDAVRSFREARSANIQTLRSIAGVDWFRSGSQEGVGAVSLCDIPSMMAQHDAAHRAEIEKLVRERRH
jgi:hypothetical protein